jgi:hypothetical protein
MFKRGRNLLGQTAASLLLLTSASALVGQDEIDARLKQALADWQHRRSYPAVQYEIEGLCLTTKETIAAYNDAEKRKPPYEVKDFGSVCNVRLIIDVKGQRHRVEERRDYINVNDGKITRVARVNAFDGSILTARDRHVVEGQEVKPSADTPDVAVVTGNMGACGLPGDLVPVFAGHGVILFPPIYEIIPGKLDADPDVSLMTVDRSDVFEGRRCLVVRSHPRAGDTFEEFWIDSARKGALVRWMTYSRAFPTGETSVRYQQQGPYWLVSTWTSESRIYNAETKQAHTSMVRRFKVVKASIERDLDDGRFRLPIEPGMLVTRVHNEPGKNPLKPTEAGTPSYSRVGSTGSEVGVYFEKGVEHRRWDLTYLWVLAIAIFLVAAGYTARRLWNRAGV